MDNCRELVNIRVKENRDLKKEVKETVYGIASASVAVLEFIVYVLGYALNGVYRFFRSERAAYVFAAHKKIVCGVAGLTSVFAIAGIVGGIEAGFISLAIGVPVCILLALVIKLVAKD